MGNAPTMDMPADLALPASAPDYIEPVIGWKVWGWSRAYGLTSPWQQTAWIPRQATVARCFPPRAARKYASNRIQPLDHEAPDGRCICGIYALRDLPPVYSPFPVRPDGVQVVGTIRLWGRILEGEHGWRGQFAYPDRLIIVENTVKRGVLMQRRRDRVLRDAFEALGQFDVRVETVASGLDLPAVPE